MNSATIYGVIASEPDYVSGARTRTLDFTIAVKRPSKKPGGAGADFIPVRCWNALADELKDAEYGDRILVQGRLRMERGGGASISVHDAWLPDYEEDTHGGRPARPSADQPLNVIDRRHPKLTKPKGE